MVEAPAKVNLHLGVGARRSDGFHEVETVLQAIDLRDTLTVRHADVPRFSSTTDLGIPNEDNLAWRAAMLLAERLGREPLVEIVLDKNIPVGAGLGGGSSDAAAVIAALAQLWDVVAVEDGNDESAASGGSVIAAEAYAREPVLAEVAELLGADVPFFLRGGTALFAGRGDDFVERIDAPVLDLAIVRPASPVNTAAAYAEYDRIPVPAVSPDALIAACEAHDVEAVARNLANNMERAASSLVPHVADALAWVRAAEGVLGATVAGSGSAVFGICLDTAAARETALAARKIGWWAEAARSRSCGVRVRSLEEA